MATRHIPINSKQYNAPIGPEQQQTAHYDPNQYAQPAGPARPTTYQKIRQSVRNAAEPVASAANAAYDAGAQAQAVGHAIGQNPRLKAMRNQDGFTAPVQAAPRSPTSRQQYPNAPVEQTSTMHPGNHLYVIQGTMISSKSTEPKQPRQPRRRSWQTGGLGGDDPGF